MKTVDLNADLGEGMPWDFDLLRRVTSANVSCGAHAGDPAGIAATLAEAARLGVVVGAHPGWPDRAGFGREERSATRGEVEAIVVGQVEWLAGLGTPVRYLKPHGALYNQAMRDGPESAPIRLGLIAAAVRLGLPILGQPRTELGRLTAEAGLPYVHEGFPDRRYRDDGRLVSRKDPGAVIDRAEDVAESAIRLVGMGVASLCLHGDGEGAAARADAILDALARSGVRVAPFLAPSLGGP